MGKVNMKLLQGIEAFEGHFEKDKEMQEVHVPKKEEKVEVSNKVPDTAEDVSGVQPKLHMEVIQVQEKSKKKAFHMSGSKTKSNTNKMKHVFSFRAVIRDINIWKAYATASGKTMESIGNDAMNEYIKKHKLSEVESTVFNALIAKNIDT